MHEYILRPEEWVHEDGQFVTFTCDVKGGVCCEFGWYIIDLDWHVVRKPILQVILNVVTADMWLEASCENAGKPLTCHGTQATSLAVPRLARFIFGASSLGLQP